MSELHVHKQPRSNTLFWRVYMMTWTVIAGGALTYLGVFALNTDHPGRLLASPQPSHPESNRAELDRARLSEQVRSLNNTVASLRSDLARIKGAKDGDGTQDGKTQSASAPKIITVRPVRTETADLGPANAPKVVDPQTAENQGSVVAPAASSDVTTASIPKVEPIAPDASSATNSTAAADRGPAESSTAMTPPPIASAPQAVAAQTPVRRARGPNLATSPLRPGRMPPLPPMHKSAGYRSTSAAQAPTNSFSPTMLNSGGVNSHGANNAATMNPIKTSSVPVPLKPAIPSGSAAALTPQGVAFGQPSIKPGRNNGSAALSLSTASSVTGLRASWLVLTTSHTGVFQNYTPRYIVDPATGGYRLLAGPISSRMEADQICTQLRADGVNCGVTEYAGTPF